MLKIITGAAAGAAIGFAVGFILKRGNTESENTISTNPFISAAIGALIGLILASGM